MRLIWSFWVLGTVLASPSFAGDGYIDDRSTAESLVRSYYNAINLKQYGRAYDYFSEPPNKSFATFSSGFANTKLVEVLTGQATIEGAAGSVFFTLPVAIRATDLMAKKTYFNGCFTVRQTSVEQASPITPLQIKSAKLQPSKEDDYRMYSLPTCNANQAEPSDIALTGKALDSQVTQMFIAENTENCTTVSEAKGGLNEPTINIFEQTQTGNDAPTPHRLYSFQCNMGAYNSVEIYYLQSGSDKPKRLSFAQPDLDIAYVDQDGDHTKLKSINVSGWSATEELVNSEFDPKTKSITDYSKWRGIGDALSVGTWQFVEGRFVLKEFAVDPTYDGEQNLEVIVKNGQVQSPYIKTN